MLGQSVFAKKPSLLTRRAASKIGGNVIRFLIMVTFPIFVAACQTSESSSASAAATANERPASRAELQSVAVGRTLASGQTFNADGTYRFKGQHPGRYTIGDGRICVNFVNGYRRCDRIVTDGTTYTLINQNGRRFPFG